MAGSREHYPVLAGRAIPPKHYELPQYEETQGDASRGAREGASRLDVAQLLRVAHDIDRNDASGATLERHRVDRPVRFAHHEARKPIDGCGTHLHRLQRRVLAGNTLQEPQNFVRAVDRLEGRGTFAA